MVNIKGAESRIAKNQPLMKKIKSGTVLFEPETKIGRLLFLKKGLVRQYWVSREGEEITIHIFKPGSLFPLMLLLGNIPNNFYFQAKTDLEVQEFPVEQTLETVKNNPALLLEFTQKFALAINGLSQRIEILASQNSATKVLLFLDYLSNQFGERNGTTVKITLPLTQSEIASWVGSRRETVSRQLNSLVKKGVIALQGSSITILDTEVFLEERSKLEI